MRVNLQPAFVLHKVVYRETSWLVDLLTSSYGRITTIARGARNPRSRMKCYLQPFVSLLVSWSGKTELVTLSNVEAQGAFYDLKGDNLISGIYVNELLTRLLHRYDPHPDLFNHYHLTLKRLHTDKKPHSALRYFEKRLLNYLGYGLLLDQEATTGEVIYPERWYVFTQNQGLIAYSDQYRQYPKFSGDHLLAIHRDEFEDPHVLKTAKQLLRLALMPLMNGKPIRSRELFCK